MTFLPVVERELRAAARRKGTFRVRWWTAVIGIFAALFSISILNHGTGRPQGASVFAALTAFCFGLTLLAGVLLTADALSEEKRMGTLGLLFLTDLRGHDVVLGKLAATSLNAAYGLLALVPAIGLALLLGGVTGSDLLRVALALLNSLFVSLAAGLAVSAFMRDTPRAMGTTIGVLFLLVFVVPFLAAGIQWNFKRELINQLATLSPLRAFQSATRFSVSSGTFALYLLASNLVGWLFIALASWRLPRFNLEEKKEEKRFPKPAPVPQLQPSTSRRHREKLLGVNPVLWLLSTEPSSVALTWIIVGAWLIAVLTLTELSHAERTLMTFQGAKVGGFILKILIAIQACRFFAQARANGALEMLATTPLTNRDVLKGQWLHLKRLFLWPVVIFWASNFVPFILSALTGFGAEVAGSRPPALLPLGVTGMAVLSSVSFAADIMTVVLVGMRLALTMRKASLAPAVTILIVLVLPSFLCWFDIAVDVVLSSWAYSSLKADYRYCLK